MRYGIICNAEWRTRALHVALRTGAEEQALHLTTDGEGLWESAGRELEVVRGCVDVDLEITPSTNTLPIRRLTLSPGASAAVTAAWIRFPSLAVEPLGQTYTRLDDTQYRYASGTDFIASLEVDDLGLVTRYADLWERTCQQDGSGED